MNSIVRDKVHFQVTVSAVERDGHWVAKTLETSLFGYGDSREEAEMSAGDANVLVVAELKRQGIEALRAFMDKYGIEYTIGALSRPEARCANPSNRLMRAA